MPSFTFIKSLSDETAKKIGSQKMSVDLPVAVVQNEPVVNATPTVAAKVASRPVKKYAVIGITVIVVVGILLAAVLGGIYIFTEANKEIVKFTMNLKNNAKQEVISDPNTNVVQYRLTNPGQEALVINDFNKDIQVVKMTSEFDKNCYVTALNRSNAMDPKDIVTPTAEPNLKASKSLTFVKSTTPITDSSFLCKAARDACQGVSVYWVYPQCTDYRMSAPNNHTNHTENAIRRKRSVYNHPPYYVSWDDYDSNGHRILCFEGCCRTICACHISFYWYVSYSTIYCTWITYSCPPRINENPVYDYCSYGPSGRNCPNYPRIPPSC